MRLPTVPCSRGWLGTCEATTRAGLRALGEAQPRRRTSCKRHWPPRSRRRNEDMKTDDLISMLSTNVERVDRGQVVRNVSFAILVGTAAALVAMLFAHGVRTDLSKVSTLIYLPLKLVFTIGTLVLTAIALTKLARPGGERTTPVALVALPFLMIMLLAAISLAAAPSSHWKNMIVG